MTGDFEEINPKTLKLGMRFTEPVFFDDETNMFLAKEKSVKPYHINALKMWNIDVLLTKGRLIENVPDTAAV